MKTLCFHCRGHCSAPGQGMLHGAASKKETKASRMQKLPEHFTPRVYPSSSENSPKQPGLYHVTALPSLIGS